MKLCALDRHDRELQHRVTRFYSGMSCLAQTQRSMPVILAFRGDLRRITH